jgi:hypothetical protein
LWPIIPNSTPAMRATSVILATVAPSVRDRPGREAYPAAHSTVPPQTKLLRRRACSTIGHRGQPSVTGGARQGANGHRCAWRPWSGHAARA